MIPCGCTLQPADRLTASYPPSSGSLSGWTTAKTGHRVNQPPSLRQVEVARPCSRDCAFSRATMSHCTRSSAEESGTTGTTMVASTIGTTNAGSGASRTTSQSPGVEHSADGQQEGGTADDLGSRQESDLTHHTQPARVTSPSSSDISAELPTWDDPSVQGWGYWPPEVCTATASHP